MFFKDEKDRFFLIFSIYRTTYKPKEIYLYTCFLESPNKIFISIIVPIWCCFELTVVLVGIVGAFPPWNYSNLFENFTKTLASI